MEIEAPPSSPAQDAARAEAEAIAKNPENPRYAGYWRGDTQVMDYLGGLYKKAFPDATPVRIGNEGVSATSLRPDKPEGNQTETPTDAQTNDAGEAQELAQLRDDWANEGIEYDAGLREAREMAQVLIMADLKLYQEAARRLGDGLGLRLLRLLRQRVNLS